MGRAEDQGSWIIHPARKIPLPFPRGARLGPSPAGPSCPSSTQLSQQDPAPGLGQRSQPIPWDAAAPAPPQPGRAGYSRPDTQPRAIPAPNRRIQVSIVPREAGWASRERVGNAGAPRRSLLFVGPAGARGGEGGRGVMAARAPRAGCTQTSPKLIKRTVNYRLPAVGGGLVNPESRRCSTAPVPDPRGRPRLRGERPGGGFAHPQPPGSKGG